MEMAFWRMEKFEMTKTWAGATQTAQMQTLAMSEVEAPAPPLLSDATHKMDSTLIQIHVFHGVEMESR